MSNVIISLHDVAPATAADSAAMLAMVEHYGLRATLLVIPGPFKSRQLLDDPGFAGWLREAESHGHELALHGWSHCAVSDLGGRAGFVRRMNGQVMARGCAEFLELDSGEARSRIVAGLEMLDRFDIRPTGFTPPGWLASRPTFDALRQLGFAYTTSQWAVFDLLGNRAIRVGALSQRPGSSLGDLAAAANARIGRAAMAMGMTLRIAIHPQDRHHLRIHRVNEQLLSRVADQCESLTYADLVGRAVTVARA